MSVFLYCYECHRLDDVEPAEPVLGGRAREMSGAKSLPQARGSVGTCATCYALSGIWAGWMAAAAAERNAVFTSSVT